MPFDFTEFKHYSINYKELFEEINSLMILNNSFVQTQYLNQWKKVLEEHDAILCNELKTQKSIREFQIKLLTEPEIFQLPMNFKTNVIYLHFRVSIVNSIIADYKSKAQHIPLEEFIKSDTTIKWTPVDTNVDFYSNSKEPIVVVPFLNNQYNMLVIDGNHRLTYKTKYSIDDICALTISEKSVIEHSIFSSSFDKLFYIMHNEINHMAYATHYQKANAMQIVQKSYLTNGIFKFG